MTVQELMDHAAVALEDMAETAMDEGPYEPEALVFAAAVIRVLGRRGVREGMPGVEDAALLRHAREYVAKWMLQFEDDEWDDDEDDNVYPPDGE